MKTRVAAATTQIRRRRRRLRACRRRHRPTSLPSSASLRMTWRAAADTDPCIRPDPAPRAPAPEFAAPDSTGSWWRGLHNQQVVARKRRVF